MKETDEYPSIAFLEEEAAEGPVSGGCVRTGVRALHLHHGELLAAALVARIVRLLALFRIIFMSFPVHHTYFCVSSVKAKL